MSSLSGTGNSSLAKGGPTTQEGKEVVRWNATRHGIRSPAPVVPGVEKKEEWGEHREGMLESLQPEGHLELVFAERVALLSWRLNRVTRYETESIALYQEQIQRLAMSLVRESLWSDGCLFGRSQKEDSPSLTTAAHEQERGCPGFLCEPLLCKTLRQGGQ